MTPEREPPGGRTLSGRPIAFDGRSYDPGTWARLSAWDRYGPDGRVWSGVLQRWCSDEEHEAAVRARR